MTQKPDRVPDPTLDEMDSDALLELYDFRRLQAEDVASEMVDRNMLVPLEWRCFSCGELFTDEEEAAAHFGTYPHDQSPVCAEARDKSLQDIVSTSRETWLRLDKTLSQLEQAEFERDCWAQVGRRLTGKPEATWHDFAAEGASAPDRESLSARSCASASAVPQLRSSADRT